jgi:hypothetical protein
MDTETVNWSQLILAAKARVLDLRGAEAILDGVKAAAGLAREHDQAFARRDAAKAEAVTAEAALAEAKAKWDAEYATADTNHIVRLRGLRQIIVDVERQKAEALADYAQAKKTLTQQFETESVNAKNAFDAARDTLGREIDELTSRRAVAQAALDALKRA